jgi:hypothetical protein
MAFRSDITIDWHLSPRIIRIAAPSTEVGIQDLHDTVRELEQDPNAMQYPFIISTEGKQLLGPGVFVGLTTTLQNARIAFDARQESQSSGTITTADTTGTELIDADATFITDGVEPGAQIVNISDGYGSGASVVTVVSETRIATDILDDGYDNQFNIGDNYKIWPVIQCEVAGGNIVAVDGYGNPLDPILPTFGTQVVRTSSSSATLTELEAIQFSSFQNAVTVDPISGTSGTSFPTGTRQQPVNNLVDALTIANDRGILAFLILEDMTIDGGLDFTDFIIRGLSESHTTLTISAAANVTNCEFGDATVQGTLDGGARITNSQILNLAFVDGFIKNCVLTGTITLSGTSTAHFIDCWSGVPGTGTPVIDFNGTNAGLEVRDYDGGLRLTNKSGTGDISVDMNSGHLILDSTVTSPDGYIVIRGVGRLTDNSSNSVLVNDMLRGIHLIELHENMEVAAYEGAVTVDVVNGTAGTTFPIGTARQPVDNVADALTIAAATGSGLTELSVIGNVTLTSGDFTGFTVRGENYLKSTITIDASANVTNATISKCTLQGTLDANANVSESLITTLNDVSGQLDRCIFDGYASITIAGDALFTNCVQGEANEGTPEIDMGSDGYSLSVRNYAGDATLTNKIGTDPIVFGMSSGTITVDSTVTNGTITFRGVGNVTDNSPESANVNTDDLVNPDNVATATKRALLPFLF